MQILLQVTFVFFFLSSRLTAYLGFLRVQRRCTWVTVLPRFLQQNTHDLRRCHHHPGKLSFLLFHFQKKKREGCQKGKTSKWRFILISNVNYNYCPFFNFSLHIRMIKATLWKITHVLHKNTFFHFIESITEYQSHLNSIFRYCKKENPFHALEFAFNVFNIFIFLLFITIICFTSDKFHGIFFFNTIFPNFFLFLLRFRFIVHFGYFGWRMLQKKQTHCSVRKIFFNKRTPPALPVQFCFTWPSVVGWSMSYVYKYYMYEYEYIGSWQTWYTGRECKTSQVTIAVVACTVPVELNPKENEFIIIQPDRFFIILYFLFKIYSHLRTQKTMKLCAQNSSGFILQKFVSIDSWITSVWQMNFRGKFEMVHEIINDDFFIEISPPIFKLYFDLLFRHKKFSLAFNFLIFHRRVNFIVFFSSVTFALINFLFIY